MNQDTSSPAVPTDRYDYILAGAGCAGLSLAMHLLQSPTLRDKSILLIDKDPKTANDRTWCFWETQASLFESIVYRKWEQLKFFSDGVDLNLDVKPYTYKMIRGIDFYHHCFQRFESSANVSFIQGTVHSFGHDPEGVYVDVAGKKIRGSFLFNSLTPSKTEASKIIWLLQHFRGWHIQANEDCFDPATATLMDFRMEQTHGTSFCYVLPYNAREALVEYTLFSPSTLPRSEYDQALQSYVQTYITCGNFEVLDTEEGQIPMTNYRFSPGQGRIVNIGTAGGQTKGSSGYTFRFIQKHSAALVNALENHESLFLSQPSRFHFYDSVLLDVLDKRRVEGKEIFARMFQKNNASSVLRFLDNESSLHEELNIIGGLPILPFTRSALHTLF